MRRVLVVVSLVAAAVGVGISFQPHAALALPSGFVDTVIPAAAGNTLSGPTGITALPGGGALVTEKGGAVRVLLANDTVATADALTLSVCTGSEQGLLGAAVDPAFASNGYVYLYYSRNAGDCNSPTGRFNRVSRFTMNSTTNLINIGTELILLDNMDIPAGNHNGGDLEFGADGYLYVTVGDGGSDPKPGGVDAAQDLSILNGKILRITTAGASPADNPFKAATNHRSCATAGINTLNTDVCEEIYAYGLRNPYRFAFDSNSPSTFFINDVGDGTWEEVDQGGAGLNYGWTAREGFCQRGVSTGCSAKPAQFTDPLTAYNHSIGCTFITAGAFVPIGLWPATYDDSYLFADGGCGKMWRRAAAGGAVDYDNPFATVTGGIVDMTFTTGVGGRALYYVTNGGGQIRKIRYTLPVDPLPTSIGYRPLTTSTRPYDTRTNPAATAGRLMGADTRDVDLQLGDSTVRAALVNLTMVQPDDDGFVTAWAGGARPPTSNLNAAEGEIVANASIVPVDANGHIAVFSSVPTHLVIDVMGVFTETAAGASAGRLTSLTPGRLIDTREPVTAANSFTRAGAGAVTTVTAPVASRLGVPANVQAVALIVTGVADAGSGGGYVTAYPAGSAVPPTSNLNVNGDGDVRPNLVIVPLGANGSISVVASNVGHVVVDVVGYFLSSTATAGSFHAITPDRQADSRVPLGFDALGLGTTRTLDPSRGVPNSAIAISQNVTMTNTLGGGFVTAFPSDVARPLASNGNATGPSQTRASLTLTKVGGGGAGTVSYYSSGGTDLVVDITGYFD